MKENNNPYLDSVDQQKYKSSKKMTRTIVKQGDYPNLKVHSAL